MALLTRRTVLRLTFAAAAVPVAATRLPAAEEDATPHVVVIGKTAFTPTHITIRAGETIRWTNEDDTKHSAWDLFDNFDTGLLAPGQSAMFTFHAPSTYSYRCRVNGEMRGTVTVTR